MEGQDTSAATVSTPKRLLALVRRFWWAVAAVIAILVLLIAVQVYRASIDKRWDKAKDYYSKADYAKAAKEMEGLSMPKDADRLRVYSQSMLATQQLDKASKGYQKLYDAKKDPFDKVVLGNIYNQQKKYDDAAKIYKEVIKANPAYVQAYINLSTMYRLQQNNKAAVDVAKEGVKNNPNSVALAELLVSMTMDSKDSQDYKDAVATLKKINPNSLLLQSIK